MAIKGTKLTLTLFAVFFMAVFSPNLLATPQVVTMTVQPASPNFGDRITVTIVVCANKDQEPNMGLVISTQNVPSDARLSGGGQVFIISNQGINVHSSVPAATMGGEVGYVASAPVGGAYNCSSCGQTNDGHMFTFTYGTTQPLTVPDSNNFPGCTFNNLYLHTVWKDNNLNDGEFHTQPACSVGSTSWSIPTLNTNIQIHKRMEGVLQQQNDLFLISVDYEYSNGTPWIRETVPNSAGAGTSYRLVSAGPQGGVVTYAGPAAGTIVTPGQGLTWTLPNRWNMKGTATGTVWFLLRVEGANPAVNTRIDNTANAQITGPTGTVNDTSQAYLVAGQPAITITKQQSSSAPMWHDNITYFLEYQINGSQLVAYQPFDELPAGMYSATPPTGWQFRPSTSNGVWYIEDQCNTGDKTIRGDTTVGDDYPGLLYSGYPMTTDTDCYGIVKSEVFINPAGGTTSGYEGADALVVIRDDGLPANGRAYGLVLSIDDYIGTNATGNVGFQRCGGGTSHPPYNLGAPSYCEWNTSVQYPITGNKWYEVKVQTGPGDVCAFSAKVWLKGDPEPFAWTITWTDTFCVADGFNCSGSGRTWYAGVAEQGGATALTQDSYNNFMLLKPRVAANTTLYDTCPTGVFYVGQQGPDPVAGTCPMMRWNLGSISDEGGTFTWWGRVDTCAPITNIAAIDGADPIIPILSNEVIARPICPQVTGITKTANVTQASVGQIFTWRIQYCNTGPGTISNYTILDTRPTYMSYIGCGSSTAAPCGIVGQQITWNVGAVPNVAVGACPQGWVEWWGQVLPIP